MTSVARDIVVRCPRCGYDQRGMMATWDESCPLDGVCTECGLGFRWAELLNPRLMLPRWCVEADGGILSFPLRGWRTLWRTHLPWRLWAGIGMSHPPRWRRLIAYVGLMLAVMYLAISLATGLTAMRNYQVFMNNRWGITRVPATTTVTVRQVFIQASITPFSGRSPGTATIPAGGGFGGGAARFNSPLDNLRLVAEGMRQSIGLTIIDPLCCGLAFAALPISRRRAKVRRRHIVRAVIYCHGLLLPPVLLTILSCGWSLNWILANPWSGLTAMSWWIAAVLLWIFWWMAARRYLRMEHAGAVATSVFVLGILLPLTGWGVMYYWFE